MKVRTAWLVIPIVLAILLVGIAVYTINYFQIEKSDTGYAYKEQLFVKDEVGTVEITVSDKNWNKILDDPTAEEYVEASVTINGSTYENVGIRAKGNSSLSSVASSDSERYSLKVDFAQYDSNQSYYGLDTLNLNNNFSDSTQMKEFVSYELMEQLGIATPAHSYVKVMVNGEYYGLLLAVEEIGEAFAKTNYGSTEGFIFKPEGTGSDLKYVSDDNSDYTGIFDEAKMNQKTAENNSNVVNMMKEISEGDTSSLDVDQLARYFALNTALVNMDSYQGPFKHNYYLREDENGVFSIIPWDYNMAFGGFSGMGGGRGRTNQGQPDAGNDKAADGEQADPTQNEGQQPSQQGEAPAQGNMQPPANMPNGQNGEQSGNAPAQGNMQPPANMPNVQNGEQPGNASAQGNMQPSANMPNGQQQAATDAQANGQKGRGGQRGGMMDMMSMGQNMLTDSNINFSITEPVSSTTVDERPLLKIILEDEEARVLYDGYLEKIATELLTEENILAITEPLEALLTDAVEEDPSKFGTTEQFLEGIRGEKSLAEFAKQRSESILKQLAGEIEGVSAAGSGFGGGMPGMNNGEMPDFGNMPDFENMPDFGEGGPPNFGEGGNPGMNGGPSQMGDGEMPGMPGQMQQQTTYSPMKSLIIIGVSLVICILGVLFVVAIGKRKYKRK